MKRLLAMILLSGLFMPVWGAAARINPERYWPHGVVPYVIDPSIRDAGPILRAMREWERAGIRFPEHTTEADYVVFTLADKARGDEEDDDPESEDMDGAHSKVGRMGGRQLIAASGQAVPWWRYLHEIGHALGLFHEHMRLDRDRWITIHWDNIAPKAQANFRIKPRKTADVGDFNLQSIMLYTWNMNAIDKRLPTITWNRDPGFRDFGAPVVQKLSPGDIAAIHALYFEGGIRRLGR